MFSVDLYCRHVKTRACLGLKEFADDNFEFDENGRKFSEWVENAVGKREITCYKQFLFFQQCFQKTCTADTLKPGLVWERVKHHTINLASMPLDLQNVFIVL